MKKILLTVLFLSIGGAFLFAGIEGLRALKEFEEKTFTGKSGFQNTQVVLEAAGEGGEKTDMENPEGDTEGEATEEETMTEEEKPAEKKNERRKEFSPAALIIVILLFIVMFAWPPVFKKMTEKKKE
ncbi:hypothetical protein [Treponema pedis]|uniref:hypothetical protein n=1 Tax=Treponema pedis TaxID=409322 RepID=UPI001981279F|nr:hypothetical protein [Treponema pedis]QSI03740.1 hypothetical protein DYQ05_01815 [Treponema pedis]